MKQEALNREDEKPPPFQAWGDVTAIEHPQSMTVDEYFQLHSLGVHFLLADAYVDVEFEDAPPAF